MSEKESTVKKSCEDKNMCILKKCIKYGNLGLYTHADVTQIVLFNNNITVNYFTDIALTSEKSKEEGKFEYLTKAPITINKKNGLKLAISRCIISINKVLDILEKAEISSSLEYAEKKVKLDSIFGSGIEFVPTTDPTGCAYNIFVPLERYLYGSNFRGNYYVFELFSEKQILNELVGENERVKIQNQIKKYNLSYQLDKLFDRIGNVIVKMPVQIIEVTPKTFSERGIILGVKLKHGEWSTKKFCLNIVQSYDGIIYSNEMDANYAGAEISINANRLKNTISIIDLENNLILYTGIFDFTLHSNYFSQVTPPTFFIQGEETRILHLEGQDININLSSLQCCGKINYFNEQVLIEKRRAYNKDNFFRERNYLISYNQRAKEKIDKSSLHEKAIQDIKDIINNEIIWDLEEIFIVDPYLTANDLANTVFQCKVKGIIIKALCDWRALKGFYKTEQGSNDQTKFEKFKDNQSALIEEIIGGTTDLQIDYRISRGDENSSSFHDRFIVLRYKINKERVWSLGASINSIGKRHSIIQIVETPNTVISDLNKLWDEVKGCDNCCIFKNINKV